VTALAVREEAASTCWGLGKEFYVSLVITQDAQIIRASKNVTVA
jgi:hypothetical protein